MRSRSTTSCRSSGLARLALAAAGLAVAGLAAPVAAQSGSFAPWPPQKWAAQESLDSHQDAHDEGVDIVYWHDTGEDEHWIYVTGWVTEMDGGDVKGTRMVTYKYDATYDDGMGGAPSPTETAYFPPLGTSLIEGDTYKAVAMTVDPNTGDIYVTGEGPSSPGGTDQDYVVIRYDKDLDTPWTAGGSPVARFYDGPVSGDDIPADIELDRCGYEVVVVTGTSPGNGTGLDIATCAWYTDNGDEADDLWPSDGVRRYNYDPEDGDDRGVAVAEICISVEENQRILSATVLGTSWGGSTTQDDYVHLAWAGTSTTPAWPPNRYDNGGNDIATAMSPDGTVVTGYSQSGSDYDLLRGRLLDLGRAV